MKYRPPAPSLHNHARYVDGCFSGMGRTEQSPMPDPALPQPLTTPERQQAAEIERLKAQLSEFGTLMDRIVTDPTTNKVLTLGQYIAKIDAMEAALAQAQQQLQKQSAQLAEAEAGWAEESRQLQKTRAVVDAARLYVAWWDEPLRPRLVDRWQSLLKGVETALKALDAIEPYRQVLHTHQSGSHAAQNEAERH